MSNFNDIATTIKDLDKKIIVIYGFNSTGKTSLSVAFKDITKKANGDHTGVYYNAFSEDLFVWNNDTENSEKNIHLSIKYSSINVFHSNLTEDLINEKLAIYKHKYKFTFTIHDDVEKGIESITFFTQDGNNDTPIKISRGEERIFVWCFYLALFEVGGWANIQNSHFFIDDPVSSLDDHNIFLTLTMLYNLIDNYYQNKKIIITTHHIGLFSALSDWLTKGEKSSGYKDKTQLYILKNDNNSVVLEEPKNNVFLYHLHLLVVLNEALNNDQLHTYHFVLLRQVLENIASFLGTSRTSDVLKAIGIDNENQIAGILNTLSHKNRYYFEDSPMQQASKDTFKEIFEKLKQKYKFKLPKIQN